MTGRAIWLILRKDVLIELRTREVLASMGLFGLLIVVVFAFAFSLDKTRAQLVGPGIIWVTILFSGTLGLYRLFDRERDNAAMSGLLLSPGGPMAVYIAKVLGLVSFITVTEIIVLPLMLAFMDMPLPSEGIPLFALALIMGVVGFSVVAVLFGGMLASTRLREVLIPIVVYPIVIPVIIGGVKLTGAAMGGGLPGEAGNWIRLMAGFDLIYLALCPWVFTRVMVE
jgi:heme exporter protein CcmB